MGVMALNHGRAGVWDSPLATDQYVQQFGFLFGGGRSGVRGIQALQTSATPLVSVSTSSVPKLARISSLGHGLRTVKELDPLTVSVTGGKGGKVVFSRFAAVP